VRPIWCGRAFLVQLRRAYDQTVLSFGESQRIYSRCLGSPSMLDQRCTPIFCLARGTLAAQYQAPMHSDGGRTVDCFGRAQLLKLDGHVGRVPLSSCRT